MAEEVQFLDNRAIFHTTSADTGDYALIESIAPAGSQPPLHVHRDEAEGFYVLDGGLTLWVGDETHVLRPGEFHFAPAGIPHTLRTGDDGARWLLIAGGRFEAFVRTVATLGEPDPEQLTHVAAEHGIEILGPPGMLPAQLAA